MHDLLDCLDELAPECWWHLVVMIEHVALRASILLCGFEVDHIVLKHFEVVSLGHEHHEPRYVA